MSYNFSSSMFIGDTSQGIPQPVFFDPHTQIFNDQPPGCLITGQPGSGKSYLAMTLTAMSAILGKTTIVLDPKGDFISLMNLKQDIGSFNLWNLSDKRRRGILDPFRMAEDPGEQLDLAITLIEIFTGGLTGDQKTALAPIIKDVIDEPRPSLAKVVQELRGSQRSAARDLGTTLDLIMNLPLAGLCFAPSGATMETVSIDQGLTVVTLVGMDMPKEGGKDNKSRLSTGILFLLTDYIRRLMMSDKSKNPKTLVIDEAWAILQTPAGAQVIKEVALLGRSKNLAMLLVTQNNSHLKHLDIENTIATRFAFKSAGKEANSIVNDMALPSNEKFEEIIVGLQRGECLMKDWQNRYSTVQISNWRQDWSTAFQNNPLEKARAEREARG
jgi:type IV secretory pathway VirB4 component